MVIPYLFHQKVTKTRILLFCKLFDHFVFKSVRKRNYLFDDELYIECFKSMCNIAKRNLVQVVCQVAVIRTFDIKEFNISNGKFLQRFVYTHFISNYLMFCIYILIKKS